MGLRGFKASADVRYRLTRINCRLAVLIERCQTLPNDRLGFRRNRNLRLFFFGRFHIHIVPPTLANRKRHSYAPCP